MDSDRLERWRVPVRIDLAGGTLDLWPIYALMEGCVTVNAAIDLWIELELNRKGLGHRLQSQDLGVDLSFECWPSLPPVECSWIWRVLNASPQRPASLRISSPVPQGSGLGASSCLAVGLYGAANSIEEGPGLAAIVPLLRDLEAQELQSPTGSQDYYPAALGGCLSLHWDLPAPHWFHLEPHPRLMEHLILFYSGKPHHSGITNWDAYKRFVEGDRVTRQALEQIRDISRATAQAVLEDPSAVAELLEQEGRARMRLSPSVETDAMRMVRDRGLREGWYEGMKPCGAGGGGCCILVARAGKREEAEAALERMKLPLIHASITSKGLHRFANL